MPEDDLDAWSRMLDLLEADLDLAEQALLRRDEAPHVGDWEEPALTGSLPPYLLERARAVRERQRDILARIPEALGRLSRQQTLTARIGHVTTPSTSVPVFIDATA